MSIVNTYPEVGQKVIPMPDGDNWYSIPEEYRTAVGTVTEVTTGIIRPYIRAEFQSIQKPDDTVSWSFYNWKPAEETTPEDSSETITALKAEITRLEGLASRREETIARLNQTVTDAHRGFELISTRMNEEAERRSWCEEFDRIIDELNSDMPGPFSLDEREQEFEVEVEVSGSWTYTTTVSVTARSSDAAAEMVREDTDSYVDTDDLIRYNRDGFDHTVDDVEVQ